MASPSLTGRVEKSPELEGALKPLAHSMVLCSLSFVLNLGAKIRQKLRLCKKQYHYLGFFILKSLKMSKEFIKSFAENHYLRNGTFKMIHAHEETHHVDSAAVDGTGHKCPKPTD